MLKLNVPAAAFMKSLLLMPAVLAISPLTSTSSHRAPKTTPFWLRMMMLPLAISAPWMLLLLPLLTLLSAMVVLFEGCELRRLSRCDVEAASR